MKYYVVFNSFNEDKNRYEYVPHEFNVWDILMKKVLKHWSFSYIWKNGSFSKDKCQKLCYEYDNYNITL